MSCRSGYAFFAAAPGSAEADSPARVSAFRLSRRPDHPIHRAPCSAAKSHPESSMYDMYPTSWHVVDESEQTTRRNGHGGHNGHNGRRRRPARHEDTDAVQTAMNRRDNGGEPAQ